MKPFFSILIPVYNVEKYLAICIESVLRQSFSDYEIILVDDGSKDTSGQICDAYRTKHADKIRVLHKPNQGLISARREGLRLAKGQYICFLDSDDFFLGESLTKLYQVIQENGCDIVLFQWKKTDELGKEIDDEGQGAFSETGFVDKSTLIKKMINTSLVNPLWSKCSRYDLFDVEQDYSQYYAIQNGEDLLQSLPVVYRAKSVYFLKEALYGYRTNNASITHNYQRFQYKTLDFLRPLLYEYLQKMGMDTKDNINAFFEMYLKVLWDNLEALFRGVRDAGQRHLILDEIKNYSFVKKARKYLSGSSLNVMKRMGLMVFFACNNTGLEWYMKFYFLCVGIVRKTG